MPCPYAKRRGAVIYCEAAKRIVNPLTHPCLSRSRYTRCKYYRAAQEARERKTEEKPETRPPPQPQAPSQAPSTPKPVIQPPASPQAPATPSVALEKRSPAPPRPAQPAAPRTKGLTLDGRPARNCLECIYYGRKTSICLLLGVEVRDPNRPPCAES